MVVDQSMFQAQGSATKAVTTYYTKDKNGVVTEVEITREQFKAPSPGFYHLRLKALSAPFEMDGNFGKSKNVRAVFVVKAPGSANDKRMFSQPLAIARFKGDAWQPNITAKTAVGQMIGCIRGKPIAEGEPINLLDYVNGEFQAMVNQTTKSSEQYGVETYGNIVKDTWQPLAQQTMPEPQPVAAAAPVGAPSGNPFLDDDE